MNIDTSSMTVLAAKNILNSVDRIKAYNTGNTQQITAFLILCNSNSALDIFYDIFLNAETNEGKIWGLTGMRKINYSFFKKHYTEIDKTLEVNMKVGDLNWTDTVENIIPQIKNKNFIRSLTWTPPA